MGKKAETKAATTIPTIRSESVERMLAFGRELARKPVPVRTDSSTAFDHPQIGRGSGGAFANASDRVRLCGPERLCAVCKQRVALGLWAG